MSKTYNRGYRTLGNVPTIHRSRTAFPLDYSLKTTANVGTIYPFYLQEVYPGDTFKVSSNFVARVSSAFIKPVLDNLFVDQYFFYVPNRLCMDDWAKVFGDAEPSEWTSPESVEVPTTTTRQTVSSGSVADYFGLPVGTVPKGINILPFRAFALIYNEFFRNQNVVQSTYVSKGRTATASEVFNDNDWSPSNYFGKLPKAPKLKDYFTTSLPQPQKGDPVNFPLVGFEDVPATPGDYHGYTGVGTQKGIVFGDPTTGAEFAYTSLGGQVLGIGDNDGLAGLASDDNSDEPFPRDLMIGNYWARTSLLEGQAISVNDMRLAFAVQKLLERSARYGSRYNEYIKSAFDVDVPDLRYRPEYLGGARNPISIQQVAQTAPSGDLAVGNVGAYSLSAGSARFTKGFTEHGFVIGVFVIRQHHTYQQGVERFWTRKNRDDYYDPIFATIGEQPVYKSELFVGDDDELNTDVFGYNEAWADLRFRPSKVTGKLRNTVDDNLGFWTFADNYANAPSLNAQFIEEVPSYVDRTLAVESSSQDQFIFDIYNKAVGIRCLPTFSVPSLIDHH